MNHACCQPLLPHNREKIAYFFASPVSTSLSFGFSPIKRPACSQSMISLAHNGTRMSALPSAMHLPASPVQPCWLYGT